MAKFDSDVGSWKSRPSAVADKKVQCSLYSSPSYFGTIFIFTLVGKKYIGHVNELDGRLSIVLSSMPMLSFITCLKSMTYILILHEHMTMCY
jgi:hypothetical protein